MQMERDMATNNDQTVRITERLWSEEVGLAEADSVIRPLDPGYEWSNGRTFSTPKDPYAPNT